MRRNPSTVVVLVGPAPGEVLAAIGRSMNVTLIRPEDPGDKDSDGIEAAAGALRRAGRATSPYGLVLAAPLAAGGARRRGGLGVVPQGGPGGVRETAAQVLAPQPGPPVL